MKTPFVSSRNISARIAALFGCRAFQFKHGAYAGSRKAMVDVFPPERGVACDCDVRFHRPVGIDPTGYSLRVNACTHCGAVTVTLAMSDEPRAGDIRHHGNIVQAMDQRILDWLGQWPRLFFTPPWDIWYLPAMMRCQTVEDLLAAENAAQMGQRTLPQGRRLRLAAPPPMPAPAPLEGELHAFETLWEVLQLGSDTSAEQLLDLAQPGTIVSAVAVDLLLCKPELPALLQEWLRSEVFEVRGVAHELIKAWNPLDPVVLRLLIDDMLAVPLDPDPENPDRLAQRWRIEQSLRLLRGLQVRELWVMEMLDILDARVRERDAALGESIRSSAESMKTNLAGADEGV